MMLVLEIDIGSFTLRTASSHVDMTVMQQRAQELANAADMAVHIVNGDASPSAYDKYITVVDPQRDDD